MPILKPCRSGLRGGGVRCPIGRLSPWTRPCYAALPATRELRPEQTGAVHLGDRRFKRAGDWLYSGDPRSPEIGDVRLRFASAPEGRVSLLAAREDGRIVPYAAAGGGSVALAAYGEVPAATLLADAARADWRDAWALRGFATMLVLLATLFAMPELGARLRAAGRPHGVRVMLLMASARRPPPAPCPGSRPACFSP